MSMMKISFIILSCMIILLTVKSAFSVTFDPNVTLAYGNDSYTVEYIFNSTETFDSLTVYNGGILFNTDNVSLIPKNETLNNTIYKWTTTNNLFQMRGTGQNVSQQAIYSGSIVDFLLNNTVQASTFLSPTTYTNWSYNVTTASSPDDEESDGGGSTTGGTYSPPESETIINYTKVEETVDDVVDILINTSANEQIIFDKDRNIKTDLSWSLKLWNSIKGLPTINTNVLNTDVLGLHDIADNFLDFGVVDTLTESPQFTKLKETAATIVNKIESTTLELMSIENILLLLVSVIVMSFVFKKTLGGIFDA